MFDGILELFKAANSLTPLAVIALLSTTTFLAIRGFRGVEEKMDTITNNHLHELPELVENSRRAVDVLQRIEVKVGENFATINAKLDGK